MRVYRVCARRHARTAFSGEGASLYGGRWNGEGTRVVYAAEHLSLALLEILVNLVEGPTLREQLYWSIDIPDDVPLKRVERADLPAGWHTYPAQAPLQDRGDRWVREAASVGMLVPSAVVPEEWNVLLNPRHEDFERLHISDPQRLDFDERLTRD